MYTTQQEPPLGLKTLTAAQGVCRLKPHLPLSDADIPSINAAFGAMHGDTDEALELSPPQYPLELRDAVQCLADWLAEQRRPARYVRPAVLAACFGLELDCGFYTTVLQGRRQPHGILDAIASWMP